MRIVILAALAVAACAPAPTPGDAGPNPGQCDTARLGGLMGRAFTDSLRAEALRRSGARTARVIRPGDAVTMDYRADRLNVHLTAQSRVERFACG
jgi:hypothetical protein